MRAPALLAGLGLLGLGLALAGAPGCGWLRGPDVVLLTIDTLRVDHVGAFSPDSPAATPAMDALAADGVVYTQAWSPISVTGPAFVTLMTGQEPGTHGVVMNLFRGGPALSADAVTLAERLAEQGYETGAFVSGFTLRRTLGLNQGFQRYDTPPQGEKRRRGDLTARAAMGWLEQRPWNKRVLLWWHSFDAHGPLDPYQEQVPASADWAREPALLGHLPTYQQVDGITAPDFYAARYAAAVEFADAQVGQLVAALKQAGRYEHALIVLVADHGESFTERELWFDHGTHASAEQLHVPLIIKYPRGKGAGTREDALVALADIAPTLLHRLDLQPLPQADGRPLGQVARTQVTGESSHCKGEAVMRCRPVGPAGKELALRSAEATLLRSTTEGGVEWTHYDRRADSRERSPLPAGAADATWQATLDALHAARLALGLAMPEAEAGAPMDAEQAAEREALEALGYLEGEE